MPDAFTVLDVSAGVVVLPTLTTLYRSSLPVDRELTFLETDDQERDGRIFHYALRELGTTGSPPNHFNVSQITGGGEGATVFFVLLHSSDSMTFQHNVGNIWNPLTKSNLDITDHRHVTSWVSIPGGLYVPVGPI